MKSKKGTSQSENATKTVPFWHSLKVAEVSPFSLEFQTKHEQTDNNSLGKTNPVNGEIIILPFSKVLFTLNPLSVEIILPLETTKEKLFAYRIGLQKIKLLCKTRAYYARNVIS